MTRSKAHLVNQLCRIRDWDPESEQAQALYTLKILDLMICIRKEREQESDNEEEDFLLIQRVGGSRDV